MTEEIIAVQSLKQELSSMADVARGLVISDPVSYRHAGELLSMVKASRERVEEAFAEPVKKAHAAHKAILNLKNGVLTQANEVDAILRPKVAAYFRAQDEIRLEAERKAALAAAKIERVSEAANDKAHELVAANKIEEADREIEKAKEKIRGLRDSVVVPEKVEDPRIQVKKRWTFEIVNEDRLPRKFMKPDKEKIDDFVKELKDQAWKHLPGCRVFTKDEVAIKASGK